MHTLLERGSQSLVGCTDSGSLHTISAHCAEIVCSKRATTQTCHRPYIGFGRLTAGRCPRGSHVPPQGTPRYVRHGTAYPASPSLTHTARPCCVFVPSPLRSSCSSVCCAAHMWGMLEPRSDTGLNCRDQRQVAIRLSDDCCPGTRVIGVSVKRRLA